MSANTNINASEALTREQIKHIIDPFTRQMEEFNMNLVNNLNNLQFKEYFDFAKAVVSMISILISWKNLCKSQDQSIYML